MDKVQTKIWLVYWKSGVLYLFKDRKAETTVISQDGLSYTNLPGREGLPVYLAWKSAFKILLVVK